MSPLAPIAALLLLALHPLPVGEAVRVLHERPAARTPEALERDVDARAILAERRLAAGDLATALEAFEAPPWRREANALHLWGVNTRGVSWFDAGHPAVVGLDVSEMTDLEGRNWWEMALASARGAGPFSLLFPHPRSGHAARSIHRCFALADGQRVLCAGGFLPAGP